MYYTVFDVHATKDHIGETVLFGSCVSDFDCFYYNKVGILTKVHDESYIKEPYEDNNGRMFPMIYQASCLI